MYYHHDISFTNHTKTSRKEFDGANAHINYFIYGYCNLFLNVRSVPFIIISSYEYINEYVTV